MRAVSAPERRKQSAYDGQSGEELRFDSERSDWIRLEVEIDATASERVLEGCRERFFVSLVSLTPLTFPKPHLASPLPLLAAHSRVPIV